MKVLTVLMQSKLFVSLSKFSVNSLGNHKNLAISLKAFLGKVDEKKLLWMSALLPQNINCWRLTLPVCVGLLTLCLAWRAFDIASGSQWGERAMFEGEWEVVLPILGCFGIVLPSLGYCLVSQPAPRCSQVPAVTPPPREPPSDSFFWRWMSGGVRE